MADGLPDVMENAKATQSWWSHEGQSRHGRGGAQSQHYGRGVLDEQI
jgi:hypothetical protein